MKKKLIYTCLFRSKIGELELIETVQKVSFMTYRYPSLCSVSGEIPCLISLLASHSMIAEDISDNEMAKNHAVSLSSY